MMEEWRNANGRLCSAVVIESLAGSASVSRQTRMLAFPPFDPASGWSGWHVWAKEVYARLKTSYPEDSKERLLNRWTGLVLGYPDQAIEGACQ